jgi:hypothetical protein
MPNILQISVPNGPAGILWNGRPAPGVSSLLLINQDLNNIVYIGNDPSITATTGARIPIAPNGSLSVDPSSPWYIVGAATGIQPLVMVPNGQAYFLGLTQGLGNLAIPSVQSPNFMEGITGWQISKNGNAEFNNLTIRGTFYGIDFVINSTGLFFYSPTEVLGNLVLSISPNGGTGPFGETIRNGINLINGTAYQQLHINSTYNAPADEFVTGVVSEAQHAAIYAIAGFTGLPTELIDFYLIGPGSSSDNTQAAVGLVSNTANGANEAAGLLEMIVSGVSQQTAYWDVNGVHFYTPGRTLWAPTLSQTDATLSTASTTGFQNLDKVWQIPVGDITLNCVYRLTVAGTIAIGNTAQVLTLCLNAFSSPSIQLPIGAAEFLANTSYWFRAQGEVLFNPIGSNGQYFGGLTFDMGVSAANQATVAGTNQTAGGFAAEGFATSINTTVAGTIALQAKWGAVVGAPTISGRYSTLERLGS